MADGTALVIDFAEYGRIAKTLHSALGLVLNAVVLWNTRYLDAIVERLRGSRPVVPARARAPQLPRPLRLHHPAASRATTAARPERT